MGWVDWEGGFHHDHDLVEDIDREIREAEAERIRQKRAEQDAADKAENQRRRYPPNCGFCGEPLASVDYEHHHDWEQGFSPNEYGHYSCGTDIEDHVFAVGREAGGRRLTFEERVLTVATNQWGFRVPFYRAQDYGIDPTSKGAQGQSPACRRLMELRWKTDPEGLERDRTDTRTDREVMSVEHERKLAREERQARKIELLREVCSRMTTTETWTDAAGVTKPLSELTHGHLVNITIWLDDHAAWFQTRCRTLFYHDCNLEAEDVRGESVHIGIPPEVQNRMEDDLLREPLEWMRSQPVYLAVKEAILASAPVDRRAAGYTASTSPTPPPVPKG